MRVRRIAQLASTEESCRVEVVRQAIADLDFELAVALLYARVKRGHTIPIDLVCEVIPRIGFPLDATYLLGLAVGERSAPLLRLVECDAFPDDSIGFTLRAIAIHMAWQTSHETAIRGRIVIERDLLRYDARRESDGRVARILDDLDVELGVVESHASRDVASLMMSGAPIELVSLRSTMTLTRAQLNELPDLIEADTPISRLTEDIAVSAISRGVSRNEPCPCGSGLKFKRCHGNRAQLPAPPSAPIASPRPQAPRTIEDVQRMPMSEVGGLGLRRLEVEPLMALVDRLLKYRAWHQVERIVNEVEGRPVEQTVRDSFHARLIVKALRCGELEIVSRHVRHLRSRMFSMVKMQVMTGAAISSRAPDALDQLIASVEDVMRDDTGVTSANLAAILEPIVPALAILLGRNCMTMESAIQWERLLPVVEAARIRLALPPGDRATALVDVHKAATRAKLDDIERTRLAAKAKVETDSLRALLVESQRMREDAERRAAELATALREQGAQLRPSAEAPLDPAIVRELRSKIDDLQDMIRERNEELASIRRKSSSERTPLDGGGVVADEGIEEVDVDWEQDEERDRRLSIPEWSEVAASAIQQVPSHVAREALRTVGELATGELSAWRAVKRPKGLRSPILMTRIGIHHRMLFRADGLTMRIIDLVSRESLDLALKRYSR